MRKISLVLLAIYLQASDIQVSEVMSNPSGSEYENEYIELYNNSESVMHINGWLISDGNGVDSLSHLSGPNEIPAYSYALIMDPGYDYVSGPYLNLIPDSVSVYTISTDASLGSGGLSNSGESIIITRPDSTIATQMSWSSSTSNGYSWERVSLDQPDSTAIWQESLVEYGTPGFRNSVALPQFNLSLNDVLITRAEDDENVEVLVSIMNTGENEISGIELSVYLDEDQNRQQGEWEWSAYYQFLDNLASGEGLQIPLSLLKLSPGVNILEFNLGMNEDENPDDDLIRIQIVGAYPQNVLSITEIMYSPEEEQGGEWVEIQNISTVDVSLQGWTLSDANSSRHLISDSLLVLEPNTFLTLSGSQDAVDYFGLNSEEAIVLNSWSALNSSSDSVRIFDATGREIASVFYRGSWGHSGASLERRSPVCFPTAEINWKSSTHVDGGTPSGINTRQLLPVQIQLEKIDIQTPESIGPAQAVITIHFQNMGMDPLTTFEVASDADIVWYGNLLSFFTDSLMFTSPMLFPGYSNIPIRMFLEEMLLADTSANVLLGFPDNQIALNEIHYLPGEDQVEFLEFINISQSSLNLEGWSFQDRSGSRGFVSGVVQVQSDSMFLWTMDSVVLADWIPWTSYCMNLTTWPSLNNTSDSIIIRDPTGKRQLAHEYISPAGTSVGKSLERLALWMPLQNESSWGVCQDLDGFTPGRPNSLLTPPVNLTLEGLHVTDSLLWVNEVFEVSALVINSGFIQSSGASIQVRLKKEQQQFSHVEQEIFELNPGDSLHVKLKLVPEFGGWTEMHIGLQFPGDEVPEDDSLSHSIYVSQSLSPLVINEVMPLPGAFEGEWVELYNRSGWDVNLQSWGLTDENKTIKPISDSTLILAPDGYLLLAGHGVFEYLTGDELIQEMEDFPVLNNSADAVNLYDPQGIKMDGMAYNGVTGLMEGRSLERIRPKASGFDITNWGLCVASNASTPGMINSLYLDVLPSELKINLHPNPFSPNDDGEADYLAIQYDLPFEQGVMSVMIYDMAGRKIAEPVQARHVSHRGQVDWDGEASYGGKAVTGLYILKMFIDDQAGKVWTELRKVYLVR